MSSDIDAEIIQKTQKILGKFLKKPPLTEKLLRKPPFRFLHDVVSNVIKETNFLKGLYTERELVSENVKEKEEKIAFLNKVIDATKTITGIELSVRATKVIAGLEPTETNMLLQTIGMALDKKLDSSEYVAKYKLDNKNKHRVSIQEGDIKIKHDRKKVASKEDKKKIKSSIPTPKNGLIKTSEKVKVVKSSSSKESLESSKIKKKEKPIARKSQEKAATPRENTIPKKGEPEVTLKTENKLEESIISGDKELKIEEKEIKVKNTQEHSNVLEDKPVDVNIGALQQKEDLDDVLEPALKSTIENNKVIENAALNLSQNVIPIERIKTAKSKREISKGNSEEVSEPVKEVTTEKLKSVNQSPGSAKPDRKQSTNQEPTPPPIENNLEKLLVRPRSSLRPPSVRPLSARPGAPRLRNEINFPEGEIIPLGKVNVIVESHNAKEEDEEETVKMQAAVEPEYQETVLQLPTDKGHLVEQILEQIQQDGILEPTKPAVIEWEQDGFRNRNVANKEIEQLKSAIQTLTRTANPLGKLVNYLHEDIEAMQNELDMWTNSARQITADITNQKSINNESNKPLQAQLEEVQENIIKHQQQIVAVHGNILRNERRIRDLMIK